MCAVCVHNPKEASSVESHFLLHHAFSSGKPHLGSALFVRKRIVFTSGYIQRCCCCLCIYISRKPDASKGGTWPALFLNTRPVRASPAAVWELNWPCNVNVQSAYMYFSRTAAAAFTRVQQTRCSLLLMLVQVFNQRLPSRDGRNADMICASIDANLASSGGFEHQCVMRAQRFATARCDANFLIWYNQKS